jgi:hypothetical protein
MKFRDALFWMTLLLLLAYALGMSRINELPYLGDELYTIDDAGGFHHGPRQLWEIPAYVADKTRAHVPFYYMLLNQWTAVTGWQPLAARMMSLMLGLLTIAWTYRLGRDFLPHRAALYGTAILSVSMLFTQYFVMIRMYTLMPFISVILIWLYLHFVNSPHPLGWRWWAAWFACVALGNYTHYFVSLLLVGIGLYHLLFAVKNRRWWALTGVTILAGLTYVPWVGAMVYDVGVVVGRMEEFTLGFLIFRIGDALGNTLAWLPLAGILITATAFQVSEARPVRQIAFIAGASLVIMLIIGERINILSPGRVRYLLGLWPMITLLFGVGIVRLPAVYGDRLGRWLIFAAMILWLIPGAYHSYVGTERLQWASRYVFPIHMVGRWLEGSYQTNDRILNYLPDDGTARSDYDGIWHYSLPSRDSYFMLKTEEDADERIDEALSEVRDHERVWLAWAPSRAPMALNLFLSRFEDEGYQMCSTVRQTGDLQIDLYSRVPLCCAAASTESALIRFGSDTLYLTGFEVLAAERDRLSAAWTWLPGASMTAYTYSASLVVFDAEGQAVAQTDVGLELTASTCQTVEIALPDLSPGEYDLRVTAYAWETLERLPGVVAATGEQGDQLPLTTITIE